jgi:hypothetical protein
MNEILVINPSRKPRKKRATNKRVAKKGVKTMAKRKRTTRKRSITSYRKRAPARRRRRNPSTRVKRAASRVRSTLGGMNLRGALKNIPPTMVGMFAAKWAAKRFGTDANETDPTTWNWASYLKGAAGAFIAGYAMQMVKPGWGQKVLEGGISLMAYKVIENELIPKSTWAQSQFGADENYFPEEYVQTDEQGTPYLLGEDGNWYPVDERHRMMGDVLEPPGRLGGAYEDAYFGDQLEPPGRLGQDDPFAKAFFGN